jgi:hypothetical protein
MDSAKDTEPEWFSANPYVETKEEHDLIASLRARKNKERLILTEAERQLLVGVLRRMPHLRDASGGGLRGMVLSLL